MTDALWLRLVDLVPDALALEPAARATFLDAACRADDGTLDAGLRAEAVRLIAASDQADVRDALVSPVAGLVPDSVPGTVPDQIGPWRITGLLGEGGMGVVYRAERADGRVERTVALKVVRHPSPALARRFDHERRALALLEHAHIARLYDADVADGTPFLAMELIEGVPITDAADGLDAEGRVKLMLQVCAAVGYAHGRLVLHRDLKPSNVLVADTAAGPRAVVLDFGIARLLGDEDEGLTQTGGRAYTPAYAAPEQLAGAEVTTATDVYGLGALLYHVLAGQRPYDLAGATAGETERRKALPARPPSAAAPSERARALRGDLDTITLKALDPDPGRRYPTADALADDLRRHLDGLPVEARPATVGYRVASFLGRHRVLASVTAAATVLLVAVVAAFTVRLAAERDRARDEAATAQAVTDFLRGTFAEASPAVGPAIRPSELTLTDALRRGLQSADTAFTDRPAVRAALLQTLGRTFVDLGLYDDAAAPLREALRLRESLGVAPDQIETVDALALLAMWRPDLGDSDALFRRSLDLRRRVYGPRSTEAAVGLANLAENDIEDDHYDRALRRIRQALGILAEQPDAQTEDAGEVLFIFAVGSLRGGRLADADMAYADLYALAQSLVAQGAVAADDERIATIEIGYGQTRLLLGHPDDASSLFFDVLGRRAARYDPGHPTLAEAQQFAALAHLSVGHAAEAERLLRAALPGLVHGDPYPENLPLARIELARAVAAQGRPVDVGALGAEVAAVRRELGPDHAWTRYAERRVAELGRSAGS